jgi:predicted RNase H-like HicB family nuclease
MKHYTVLIFWSEEDAVFIAEAPELPGCMAHGDSHETALSNIKEAMSFWLEVSKEFGDPIPEPRGRLMYA